MQGNGKIALPEEFKRVLDIAPSDHVVFHVTENGITLQKHCHKCFICGATEDILQFKRKTLCSLCLEKMTTGGLITD